MWQGNARVTSFLFACRNRLCRWLDARRRTEEQTLEKPSYRCHNDELRFQLWSEQIDCKKIKRKKEKDKTNSCNSVGHKVVVTEVSVCAHECRSSR